MFFVSVYIYEITKQKGDFAPLCSTYCISFVVHTLKNRLNFMRFLQGALDIKKLSALIIAVFALSACSGPTETQQPNIPLSHQSNIGVQLFMWNWDSIAKECPVLAESGIDWVLTSPPQEHIQGNAWWTVYQPVSYNLDSKLGSSEQFESMISTCNEAGVEVIVDAVINHMSASDQGVGYAGTNYQKYFYPGLYDRDDFHNCQLTTNNQIQDFNDVLQVRDCELLGLSDLDQGRENVRQHISSYLQSLLDLGAAGFRIDAAKHMSEPELREIIESLPEDTVVMHEVIPGGALQPDQYTHTGDLAWEFNYAENMNAFFEKGLISTAANSSRWNEYLRSVEAVSFISNHDTERNRSTLSYRDPQLFELATATMLAEPYGNPKLYSSYAFEDFDYVPLDSNDLVKDVTCESTPQLDYQVGQWICQHRWDSTVSMIQFSKDVDREPMLNRKKDRRVYGFSRGDKGYFLVNLLDQQYTGEIQTGLDPGDYCDYFTSTEESEKDNCIGQVYEVDEEGFLINPVPANSAVAISTSRKIE